MIHHITQNLKKHILLNVTQPIDIRFTQSERFKLCECSTNLKYKIPTNFDCYQCRVPVSSHF